MKKTIAVIMTLVFIFGNFITPTIVLATNSKSKFTGDDIVLIKGEDSYNNIIKEHNIKVKDNQYDGIIANVELLNTNVPINDKGYPKKIGVYSTEFKITDKYGNSEKLILNVRVIARPKISAEDVTIHVLDYYKLDYHKAKALDEEDGELYVELLETSLKEGKIKNIPGTYDVIFRTVDTDNLENTIKTKVNIINDSPTIDYRDLELNVGEEYNVLLHNIKVEDMEENNLKFDITYDTLEEKILTKEDIGNHFIKIEAKDSFGTRCEVKAKIVVKERINKGWIKDKDNWYYLNNSGIEEIGWVKDNNNWYYLNNLGIMEVGIHKIDGKYYFFNQSGAMEGNFEYSNNELYYYNNKNILEKGWTKLNNEWLLMDSSGKILSNWQKMGNNWYYLNDLGIMQIGWQRVSNKWYYLNSSGAMETGWEKVSNNWYYLNNSGAMGTGWKRLSNNWYYLNNSGTMERGWQRVSNNWYYLNNSGAMEMGWQKVSNNWYYLNNSGAMETGWIKVSNNWYYLNTSGAMDRGWIKVSNNWYHLNNSGVMETGWQKVSNNWYYLNNLGAMETGWIKVSNNWYYLNSSGAMETGWQKVSNRTYYMDSSGRMKVGWIEISGKLYYFENSGQYNKNKGGNTLSGKLIVLDPGHGGNWPTGDSGAINNELGLKEKDLNNALTIRISNELKDRGATIIYTRNPLSEFSPSLDDRAKIANLSKADLFMSVHHDSNSNKYLSGLSVHYSSFRPGIHKDGVFIKYNNKEYKFISEVKNWQGSKSGIKFNMNGKNVIKEISDVDIRVSKPSRVALESKRISDLVYQNVFKLGYSGYSYKRDRPLYVTRWTNMPSVLLEAGYISNNNEAKRASSSNFQEKIAKSVGDAMSDFFNK